MGFESGVTLVTDPGQARVAWKSEDLVPPPYHEGINLGPSPLSIQSGHASPVLADGRVFIHYFVGSGTSVDEAKLKRMIEGRVDRPDPKRIANFAPAMLRKKTSIPADQVVLAVDAGTGATLWKTVYRDDGPNITGSSDIHGSEKSASHLTPCVADGRVFARSTGGGVYCLDAATGKEIWRTGPWKSAVKGPVSAPCDSMQVAGGVVAFAMGSNLRGLDAATGTQRWQVPANIHKKGGSALRWVHSGKEYFLTAAGLIDPADGRFLWTLDWKALGSEKTTGVFVADAGYMILQSSPIMILAISPEKAVKHATLPPAIRYTREINPVLYRGAVYGRFQEGEAQGGWATYCIDLATGAVRGKVWGLYSFASLVAGDGLVFNCVGAGAFPLNPDPADFRMYEPAEGAGQMQKCADADRHVIYQTSPETTAIYADGRLFTRTFDGLICYDLRAPARR